jgi:hypothetical protein
VCANKRQIYDNGYQIYENSYNPSVGSTGHSEKKSDFQNLCSSALNLESRSANVSLSGRDPVLRFSETHIARAQPVCGT